MTRSTQASGATFEEALTAALADVLSCEPADIRLRLEAPDLPTLTGSVRLELEIRAGDGPSDGPADSTPDGRRRREQADGDPSEGTVEEDREDDDVDTQADEGDGADEPEVELAGAPLTAADLEAEAEAAADLLEGLLDALDLPGDLRMRFHDDHVEIEVVDVGSGVLIGRRGQTLEAIQEVLRCAMQRQFQRRARVKVDIEGYRARRLEKLLEKAEDAVDTVLETGRPERLEPMDVFERKAVHQLVANVEGLTSRSQGREPSRRVIIEREGEAHH